MLKRRGNLASHIVPYHSGRLTDREYAAYQDGIQSIQPELTELMQLSNSLCSIEEEIPNPLGQGATEDSMEIKGRRWSLCRSLSKLAQSEVVLAKNEEGEFAIIERFSKSSAYAQANGANEVIMTGNDHRLLLQDHVQNERQSLQFLAADLKLEALECLTEKYPDQNHQQVTKAIAARLTHEINPQRTQNQSTSNAHKENRGVRV